MSLAGFLFSILHLSHRINLIHEVLGNVLSYSIFLAFSIFMFKCKKFYFFGISIFVFKCKNLKNSFFYDKYYDILKFLAAVKES